MKKSGNPRNVQSAGKKRKKTKRKNRGRKKSTEKKENKSTRRRVRRNTRNVQNAGCANEISIKQNDKALGRGKGGTIDIRYLTVLFFFCLLSFVIFYLYIFVYFIIILGIKQNNKST